LAAAFLALAVLLGVMYPSDGPTILTALLLGLGMAPLATIAQDILVPSCAIQLLFSNVLCSNPNAESDPGQQGIRFAFVENNISMVQVRSEAFTSGPW
jgi:hypothetical protein